MRTALEMDLVIISANVWCKFFFKLSSDIEWPPYMYFGLQRYSLPSHFIQEIISTIDLNLRKLPSAVSIDVTSVSVTTDCQREKIEILITNVL